MFKQHRSVVTLLVIVLLVGILAACSGKNNEPESSPSPTTTASETPSPATTPSPSAAPEPVELTAYSNIDDATFDARFTQAAVKQHPNFTIKHHSSAVRNLPDTIDVDQVTPDIGYGMNIADYRAFMKLGLGMDITGLASAAGFDLNQFEPGTLQTVKNLSEGKLYGLPNTSNPIVLFYNKDIFDAFGVPYPTDGMTWDQLYDTAKKVTGEKNGTKYAGFGSFHAFLFGSNQQSLPVVDAATGKAAVNNDGFKKIVDNLIRFYQIPGNAEGYNPDGNGGDDLVRFYEKKDLAMVVSLLSSVNREGFMNVNWDMVTAPTFADLPGVGYQDGVNFNTIQKTAANPEAAFQALAQYYSEENQIALAKQMIVTPLVNENVRKALGESEKLKGKNAMAVYVNKFAPTPAPHLTITVDAQGLMAKQFSKLITGTHKDSSAMLAAAEKDINDAIAAQ